MSSIQTLPERTPVIDPVVNDRINELPVIGEALFAALYSLQEAGTLEERTARCDAFDMAAHDLLMVYLSMATYAQEMREGLAQAQPGKIIRLRRRQPRDERGRFVKLTT